MGIDRSGRQITPKREPGCDRFCTDCREALGSIRLPGQPGCCHWIQRGSGSGRSVADDQQKFARADGLVRLWRCVPGCLSTGAGWEEPSPAGPPFSPSIEVDDTLYLSGQVGLDPETREMASGIQAETKVTMENLKRELEAKGCGFSDVVASHVWMTDISQIGQMSETYRSFFEGDKLPSRTTVAISKLALGATVEIAMVAVRGEKQYVYPEGTEPGKAPSQSRRAGGRSPLCVGPGRGHPSGR